jgi:hypothetical protein
MTGFKLIDVDLSAERASKTEVRQTGLHCRHRLVGVQTWKNNFATSGEAAMCFDTTTSSDTAFLPQ